MNKLIFKNILSYGTLNGLKSLIPFLLLPILTTYMTKNEYGILSLIETTILFLTPIISLNINGAINIEYFKLSRSELKSYISNALLLSFISFVVCSLLIFLFKDMFVRILSVNKEVVFFLTVFAFLRVISSVVLGLYQMKQNVKQFALYTLLQSILDVILSIVFIVIFRYGYIGRLAGTYISFAIVSLLGLYLLYKMGYIWKISFKYTKEILKFGVPLIPHAIGGTIIAMSDRYFISYFVGISTVGLYTVAYQLAAAMLLVGMSVNQAWSPVMFKLLKENNKKSVVKIIFILSLVLLISAVIIHVNKDLLFSIFVDEKFHKAKCYFDYLLIGFLFQSLYFLVTNFLFFEKKTISLANITFFGAILNLFLNYIFINIFGSIGVAYATAITWATFFFIVSLFSFNLLRR